VAEVLYFELSHWLPGGEQLPTPALDLIVVVTVCNCVGDFTDNP
jgi:hypothetical protein